MKKVVFLLLVLFTLSMFGVEKTRLVKIAANDEPGPGRSIGIPITTTYEL